MSHEFRQIVAIITDFGLQDHYVASLKASILKINPKAQIVDITHMISPQDVMEAAFVLRMAYRDFPTNANFLCVVDPGVGGPRKPILVETDDYYFVGPDNGIFSYIYSVENIRSITVLENGTLFHQPVSPTFHGRDIFAPCAAWLSRGIPLHQFGPELKEQPITLSMLHPEHSGQGVIKGRVVRADRFGNLITNIRLSDCERHGVTVERGAASVSLGKLRLPLSDFYGQSTEQSISAVWGSSGFLEIAVVAGSAQDLLQIRHGVPVELVSSAIKPQ